MHKTVLGKWPLLLVGLSLIRVPETGAFFDPLSLSAAAGAGLAAYFNLDTVKKYTVCKVTECCSEPYLKSDIDRLKTNLKTHLFGQHIVTDAVVNAIGAHLKNINNSRKPLVISFHGTTGTGKNYVSDFIIDALYKKGINSSFVHKFNAFDERLSYNRLQGFIKSMIQRCPKSLFVFDEIEKMPEGVFDSIVSLLDHHSSYREHDFTKAIFIFLTNSAGIEISQKLRSLIDGGTWRDNTKLQDFERIAEMGAYNVVGGLYRGKIIEAHVIDHFVPFLPLEPRHVDMCIRKEFWKLCHKIPSDADVSAISQMTMTLEKTGMFSNNGCKRISKKIEAYCY